MTTKEEINEKVQKMVIKDADFSDRLEDTIKPWLKAYLQEEYITGFDGTRLHVHYAIHPREKAAVVMSHGFCEFAGKFHEVMYYLHEMGYSVFFIEHRGHGFSDRAACIHELDRVYVKDYDEYVQDMKCFVDQIVVPKSLSHTYYLYAHSMGGAIGALFMEAYPDFFAKAVLSCPMLQVDFGKAADWQAKMLMAVGRMLHWDCKYVPGKHGFDHVYAYETSCSGSEPRYAYIFQQREDIPEYSSYGATYAWTDASIRATEQIRSDVAKIQLPVLLCQAGRDIMVKPEGQEYFAAHSGNTRLVRFPDAKHELYTAQDEVMLPYYQEIFDFYGCE